MDLGNEGIIMIRVCLYTEAHGSFTKDIIVSEGNGSFKIHTTWIVNGMVITIQGSNLNAHGTFLYKGINRTGMRFRLERD